MPYFVAFCAFIIFGFLFISLGSSDLRFLIRTLSVFFSYSPASVREAVAAVKAAVALLTPRIRGHPGEWRPGRLFGSWGCCGNVTSTACVDSAVRGDHNPHNTKKISMFIM